MSTETSPQQQWTTLQDTHGHSYRQISFHLHTQDYQAWGHFQVGRSLQDMERAIAKLQIALLLGLPLLILLVAVSGWGLSRLALRPIDHFCQHTQEFTADAAHELRTPVTAMRATLESLQSLATEEDPEMQVALEATIRQSWRLTQLVNDLLMLCRMEQQKLGVRKTEAFTWVSLRDLVEDTVEEFAGLALQKQIHLYTQIPITEDLQVWGNTEHLYRLLGNLMGNAIHYTPEGGKVSLVLEKRGTEAWIQVQDTGVGISSEEKAKIFERFYRGKCERPSGDGTGLGLAIAQAIVQAHEGRLAVTSQMGKGSIFIIRLPI
ncbi:HAMP domain-containing sensor histidine kinase [Spirulina sp. CS-785/01]|uniref:sensor histidine kinase n=1 Tax=Spirulina sp. CS-785/01 TaxID=3021716 RepID=UPI00232C0677|nr:HAMP domain-containing sensor histidine kinase [Spirulina sp. CS-785/01]MDB9313655.1 HAMP domain-containing sensor histidine kinase [Spirulina sp. CS-785/01]